MRQKPFEIGQQAAFTKMQPVKVTGTIVSFVHARSYCKTEQRTKLERTHAIVLVDGQKMRVRYRLLKHSEGR